VQFIQQYKNIIAALVSGCIFLSSCENNPTTVDQLNSKRLGVEEAKHVDINYTLGGRAKAKLLSPLMYRVQDTLPYVEFPKTLHVDFYNDSTSGVDSRLDALYGKYYESQSRVYLRDSVKVINIKGDTLYCDELWWDRAKKDHEFYTEKAVRIRTKTQIIFGIGMDAKQDFKDWHIINPTGFLNVPSSQFPTN